MLSMVDNFALRKKIKQQKKRHCMWSVDGSARYVETVLWIVDGSTMIQTQLKKSTWLFLNLLEDVDKYKHYKQYYALFRKDKPLQSSDKLAITIK